MGRTSRGNVMLKKENKMSFLEDVFQTADEIKQSQKSSKVLRRQAFISWMCLFDHIWVKHRTRPYLKFWKGWSRPLPNIRSKSATAAPCRRLQKRRQHSRQGPMCSSKTKTALPVGAGKAVMVTGIYMCY